ncbi:phage tail protein [Chloroflexota bacterium]
MATFRPGPFRDSLQASTFGLEIEGDSKGVFKKCSGISTKNEIVTEQKTKDGKTIIMKQPGNLSVGDITLERGYTDNMDLFHWRQKIVDGKVAGERKNCTIVLYNHADERVGEFFLEECWPAELSGPELDAGSNDIAIEKVVLACERIERKS